jgi:beta-lactamase regulating signal transducer with metallopeptidase domain/lipopolysaccharide export system protein LptA
MIPSLNQIAQTWWQWMSSMFWQVSLFIIFIALLDTVIRRKAWPQIRYVLWGLVFLKLIIPPTWQMPTSIVSWIQPKVEKQISRQIEHREVAAANSQASASVVQQQDQGWTPTVSEKVSWKSLVFLSWLAGGITFSILLFFKLSGLPKRHKKEDGGKIPEWFAELLINMSKRLKINKIPVVVFSEETKSPAVYGLFRPILLLPVGYLGQLSPEQAEHVLMHELCHLKRGDLWVHWLCLSLQIIYWFNPLLIWARRQMRHVCEICCDITVADILREKTVNYRNTLLTTARELLGETSEQGLGLLGVLEEPFRLVSRLKWLEKNTWENRKQKIASTIIAGLIVAACVMPMAGLSQTAIKNKNHLVKSEANPVESNNPKKQNNVTVSADNIEGDPASANFAGNVRISLGSTVITADSAKTVIKKSSVPLNGKNTTDRKSIYLAGKVRIEYENFNVASDTALYDQETNKIVLSGRPEISSGNDAMTAESIMVDIKNQTVTFDNPNIKVFQSKKDHGTISITAEKLEVNKENASAIWVGNAKLSLGSIVMTADNLKVSYKGTIDIGKMHDIESALSASASGNVRIEYKNNGTATCQKALFDLAAKTIVLSEGIRVTNGRNSLSAKSLKFNYSNGKLFP